MIVFYLLAMFALGMLVRNIPGPFEVFDKARIALLQNEFVGAFFYKLLSCPICVGWWCGIAVYLLQFNSFSIRELIMWGLVGSAVVFVGDELLDRKPSVDE